MDYVAYLNPITMEVHQLVQQKVRIVENGSVCNKFDIFGFFDTRKRELTICTSRILRFGDSARHINETILHESVHVAQACKGGFRTMHAFGLNSSDMVLTASREQDLKMYGRFDRHHRAVEREAFWMEDKPNEVLYVVKKYCF
jgi:hypothetical protein